MSAFREMLAAEIPRGTQDADARLPVHLTPIEFRPHLTEV
jgi:hypothetical protein